MSRFMVVLSSLVLLSYCMDNRYCFGQGIEFDSADRRSEVPSGPSSEHDSWEGIYNASIGDDMAYEFAVTRLNGFVLRKLSNSGYSEVCDGKVMDVDGEISLKVEDNSKLHPALSQTMVIVHSDKKSYLVPKDRIHGFCLDFASGSPYAIAYYFCKQEHNSKIHSEELILPDKYRSFLKLPELTGEVYEIRKEGTRFHVFVLAAVAGITFLSGGNYVPIGRELRSYRAGSRRKPPRHD